MCTGAMRSNTDGTSQHLQHGLMQHNGSRHYTELLKFCKIHLSSSGYSHIPTKSINTVFTCKLQAFLTVLREDRQNTNVYGHFCSETNGQPGHPPDSCSVAVVVASDWAPLRRQSAQRTPLKSPPCCYRLPELCRAVSYRLFPVAQKIPTLHIQVRATYTRHTAAILSCKWGTKYRCFCLERQLYVTCKLVGYIPGDLQSYQYRPGFIVLSSVQFIVGNVVYHGT